MTGYATILFWGYVLLGTLFQPALGKPCPYRKVIHLIYAPGHYDRDYEDSCRYRYFNPKGSVRMRPVEGKMHVNERIMGYVQRIGDFAEPFADLRRNAVSCLASGSDQNDDREEKQNAYGLI